MSSLIDSFPASELLGLPAEAVEPLPLAAAAARTLDKDNLLASFPSETQGEGDLDPDDMSAQLSEALLPEPESPAATGCANRGDLSRDAEADVVPQL